MKNIEPQESAITIFHESGHAIDANSLDIQVDGHTHITGASQYVDELLSMASKAGAVPDIVTLARKIGLGLNENGDWVSNDPKDYQNAFFSWADAFVEKYGESQFLPLSDIIDGITLGDLSFATRKYAHHEKEYWHKPSSLGYGSRASGEAWANYCSLRAMCSNDAIEVLKEIAPNLERALRITYMEVFGY